MTTAATPLLLRRLTCGQLLGFDLVLAAASAVLGLFAAFADPQAPQVGWHEPAWVSVAGGLLMAVPVAVRRHRPAAAAYFATVVVVACVASGVMPEYAGLAPTSILSLTLYTLGTDVPRRRSIPMAIAIVLVTAAAFVWVAGPAFGVGVAAWVLGASWTVGRTIRERRAYAARTAEQATELAVGQERLRIAREIHDIVAHSMSMIAVKATIADHIADAQPQEMREALRVIAATSRDTLGEMRRALGALRTEGTLAPTPGLNSLNELATAARSAGLTVDLTVRGADGLLPEDVALTVFRLVQEALTNVMKHSHATECRVEVEIGEGSLRLQVADDGSPGIREPVGARADGGRKPAGLRSAEPVGVRAAEDRAAAGMLADGRRETGGGRAGGGESADRREAGGAHLVGGQGLIGMRERAALFGGEVTAGPASAGGWLVATTLRWAA